LYIVNYENNELNSIVIESFLRKFWVDVVSTLNDDQYLIILFKFHAYQISKSKDGEIEVWDTYKTFDKVLRITKSDLEEVILHYNTVLVTKILEFYQIYQLRRLIMEYWVKENKTGKSVEFLSTLKNLPKLEDPKKVLENETQILTKNTIQYPDNADIPLNMNYLSWGEIKYKDDNFLIISNNNKTHKQILFHISIKKEFNMIEVRNNVGENSYNFKDYVLENKKYFIRTINNSEFYIQNNKVILKTIKFKTDVLKPTHKERKLFNKIITLDIETRVENNIHIPYCICYYDGKDKYSFYVTDFSYHYEMLHEAINSLFKPKYSGFNVYVHNLSNFDGIFLLNSIVDKLSEKIDIEPTLRNGKFINIKIKFSKYFINIRDSYLLLPLSLSKLSQQFQVEHLKTSFPYHFINDKYNKNIDLNYIGTIPNIEFFDNNSNMKSYIINVENYSKFLKEFNENNPDLNLNEWNLKKETIRYCINDCISLYEVLTKFNKFIFEKFKLNIKNNPTLPSLTFNIFISNFFKAVEKKGYYIPLIKGKIYNDIQKSYTGGSVDMFIPSIPKNTKAFCYDVNSLYPTSMSEGMNMPVISNKMKYIAYFEGDISKIEKNSFGFFNVEVSSPKKLKHPILQIKHNTGHGLRTISPLGKWNFDYFSEELVNSRKYGYKYDIKNGYLFDKFDVFKDFIKDLYKIKKSHTKDDPWYQISKLLLNCLYGRFGMDPNLENHAFIDPDKLDDYMDQYDVSHIINLNDKLLISYIHKTDVGNYSHFDGNNVNVSISIASAITAYARIFMTKFKNNPEYILYYTDTDSYFFNKELPEEFIGKKLGQFKLEYVFTEAVFIAPKVYGGITEEGKEIVKVKGLKNPIPFSELKDLLNKDKSLEITNEKWFKSIQTSQITIRDQIYTLKVTDNKRNLVYKEDKLVDTQPIILPLNEDPKEE
jgi:hypothetical protein